MVTTSKRNYYARKEGNLWVLRQWRYREQLMKGKEHKNDVMAYARSRSELDRMRKKYGLR